MSPEEKREKARLRAAAWRAANPEVEKARIAAYQAANREKIAAAKALWYMNNRDKVAARASDRHAAHPEKARARNAKWRAENPDRARRKATEWRVNNPDRVSAFRAAWVAAHPEEARLSSVIRTNKRRAAQRQGNLTAQEWQAILEEFDQCCAYCQVRNVPLQLEHMTPLSRGGHHTKANVVPACRSCNRRKSARTIFEFLLVA